MNTQLLYSCLGLDVPEIETPLERRRDERRILCEPPAPMSIVLDGGLAPVKGYILNVSRSGLGLCANRSLRRGMKVTVESATLRIEGTIRYCVLKSGSSFDIGLQIDDVLKVQ